MGRALAALAALAVPAPAASQNYNYAEVMQKSLFFYEAQRSGELPAENSVVWRGDSALQDGSDNGVDLTGGWYDAGDHVKFGLPMASTVVTLAWGIYEYRTEYADAGLLDEALDTIKWATEYFIKAHPSANEFYYQVGDGGKDHAWWGSAEVVEEVMDRPSFKIDMNSPGSCVAAGTAAALAAASIIFRDTDSSYADVCLLHAVQLYEFADVTRSDDGYTEADGFYTSFSGFWDELSGAATWLYMATGINKYLVDAEAAAQNWGAVRCKGKGCNSQPPQWESGWTHSWDDMHYMTAILLARVSPEPTRYIESVERNLDYWQPDGGITYTPGGLAWLDQWGSLRYAANAAFLAFVWSDTSLVDPNKKEGYVQFAKNQINYILGNNLDERSYVCGFGNNPPINPHHRTAHGAWYNDIDAPADNQHILFGALVGGPGNNDDYTDDRTDYQQNEVATDYNAGFTGALAKMYGLHGGSTDANFPSDHFLQVQRDPEIFVRAITQSASSNSIQVVTQTSNRFTWPARVTDAFQLSYKYFIDISSGTAIVSQGSSECGVVTGLHHWDGTIYYVQVDIDETLYPGGRIVSECKTEFTIDAPNAASWDIISNDPSNPMATSFTYEPVDSTGLNDKIPVYDNGVLLFGVEPGCVANCQTPSPTRSPTASPTKSPSDETPSPTSSPTASPTKSPSDVTPSPTRSPTASPTTSPVDTRTLFVEDIMLTAGSNGPNNFATATVTVQDESDNPVEGVQVTVEWTGGFVAGTSVGFTDGTGVVSTLKSPRNKGSGIIIATVADLQKDEYSYDASLNVETTDSVIV